MGFQASDVNLYRFVGNSPTNALDPSGLREIRVWITFVSDTKTEIAAGWHTASATASAIDPGIFYRTQVAETGATLKEAVDKLKKRLTEKDCIKYLQFSGHGKPGAWFHEGNENDPQGKKTGAYILQLADLQAYLKVKNPKPGDPPFTPTDKQKEIIEALDYLRSKMCAESDIVLKICVQAGNDEFCTNLSDIIGKYVYAKDGRVGVGEAGDWWLFPPGGEKQKVDSPP